MADEQSTRSGGVEHMDPIEAEARAYVEAWRPAEPFIVPSYSYLIGLLAVLDARDAEIARLTEQNHFFQVQYQDEAGINALSEQLVAAKAEIAQLRALPGADVMERAETILNELGGLTDAPDEIVFQESLLKNDIARALQQYGDERAADAEARAAANEARKLREFLGDPRVGVHVPPADWGFPQNAMVSAPPGTDVIERAKRLIVELCGGESVRDDDSDIIPTARAIQLYGDERAAAVREAAIEEAAQKHDRWASRAMDRAEQSRMRGDGNAQAFELTEVHVHEASAADLRALTPKPGSEP